MTNPRGNRAGEPAGNDGWDGDPDAGYENDDWSGSRNRWGGFFPPSRPREVAGGVKARSRRGSFGESWWARRWVEVIEGFRIGGRLTRGRTYARSGQVVSIRIEPGRVVGSVQGSRATPYSVAIALRPVSDAKWNTIARELRRRPLLTALLASGSLHEQIEAVFEAAGSPLFPSGFGELSTKCSCPDWSNPCKHVAAVFYLIAEELDRDGMLLLRLRGIEREQLAGLVQPQMARSKRSTARRSGGDQSVKVAVAPIPSDPDAFWHNPPVPHGMLGDVEPPADNASVVKRLGAFPLWRGNEPFIPLMERTYATASRGASDLAATLAQATHGVDT